MLHLSTCGWGWLNDRLHTAAGAHTFQAETFTLASSGRVLFELDGENIGPLPAHFSVRREALRVIVPE